MSRRRLLPVVAMLIACGAETAATEPAAAPPDGNASDAHARDAASTPNDADSAIGDGGGSVVDALAPNRDRLLATYLAFLKATPAQTQSNGVSGANVATVCDLWKKLDASAQSVFLTLTYRLQRGTLGSDASSMLSHAVKLYRVSGGQDAQTDLPGSCGGGEYNRLMLSMDATLHAAFIAAKDHRGETQANGKADLSDVTGAWRDSHDIGGTHSPFDLSDETESGAPRGQVQLFADPTSAKATAPLGRMDLKTLVDPYALEIDQDFDCVHASNPLCDYITYGGGCFPESSKTGVELCTDNYGTFDPMWKPANCP